MARVRTISAAQAVFITSTATGQQSGNAISQLHRIQKSDWQYSISRTPVSQFGQLAPIDNVILEPASVTYNTSYLATDVYNEVLLGLTVNQPTSAISGFLSKSSDEHNIYLLTVQEGNDAVGGDGTLATNTTVGIGNTFMSSYEVEAAVGSFPTVNCNFEALNLASYLSSTGASCGIVATSGTPITGKNFVLPSTTASGAGQATALRPGDVTLSLQNPGLGVDIANANIQNIRLSASLSRTPQNRLGSFFPFSRELNFPIEISISAEANVAELTTGNLSSIFCNDAEYTLSFLIRKPSCPGAAAGDVAVKHTVAGAKLVSQSVSQSVGSNSETASLNWTAQVGGPSDTTHYWWISGIATH